MTFALDKMQIDDALGLNTYQLPAGQPNPGAQFGAMQPGMMPQAPQPMAGRFGGVSPTMGAQAGPGHLQLAANVGPALNFQGARAGYSAPVAGGQLDINANVNPLFRLAQLGAKYGRGPVSGGVTYTPGQGVGGGVEYGNNGVTAGAGYGPQTGGYARIGLVRHFQEGGLATSIAAPQDRHQHDVDFINTQADHMREMVGRQAYARGGFAVK
jgi:hypothetical protein